MAAFALLLCLLVALVAAVSAYDVGVGIYDITGPATEVNFMGYALPGQRGQGIHLRLFARSYVIVGDDGKRICYVSVDGGMGSDIVNQYVIQNLEKELGQGVYTYDNLSVSGTHTHSGPAGYLQYVLYQVTSLGYVKETFDAWVNGITQSILMAHRNVQPAKMTFNQGLLFGANINRSPTSYLLNPQAEQDLYASQGDTDKNMFSLHFSSKKTGKPMGSVNWFAVHATSMNNTNKLISSDNRGYASQMMERYVNGPDALAGTGPFVAAFASTNLGDVSPNTNGAKCIDTGLPCDGTKSTCNGRCENCIAFGPGTNGDIFESTQIIGDKQFQFAKGLMSADVVEVAGPLDYRHSFVDMSKLNVTLSDGSVVTTCSPAMGYAFAAGTTDGPGMFHFTQGTTSGNPFWDRVRDFLSEPTAEEIACQAPKPILLNTGDVPRPYEWDPKIVPLSIFRIGHIFVVSVPSEFTTMAGRRLRKAMADIVTSSGVLPAGQAPQITIAGLANSYSSYVTTFEEYQAQRYEAASNIFGPHALEGYIQEYSRIMKDLLSGKPSESLEGTPDLMSVQTEQMPSPTFDKAPKDKNFGDLLQDAKATYNVGQQVEVKFVSANPRNNQRIQGTFLTVEKQIGATRAFKVVARDAEWETKFRLTSGDQSGVNGVIADKLNHESVASITWDIPSTAEPGVYRICHFGDHKKLLGGVVVPFTGCSSEFELQLPAAAEKSSSSGKKKAKRHLGGFFGLFQK